MRFAFIYDDVVARNRSTARGQIFFLVAVVYPVGHWTPTTAEISVKLADVYCSFIYSVRGRIVYVLGRVRRERNRMAINRNRLSGYVQSK